MKAEVFSRDVQEFLRCLAAHQVRYVLIGGAAVIYHGYARLTGDIDFLYDCSHENAERLWNALVDFWNGIVPAVQGPDELTNPKLVVQFGRPPNRIDLIASVPAAPFAAAWPRRVEEAIQVGDQEVPVFIIGLADLRKTKEQAGRPKDLDDLAHLRSS